VRIVSVEVDKQDELHVGDELQISATVDAGGLSAADLRVEVCSGSVDSYGNFLRPMGTPMQLDSPKDAKQPRFAASLKAPQSGYFGFTVRVMPCHEDLPNKLATYHLTWAEAE